MANVPTITVTCPDGINRQAQITSKAYAGDKPVKILSVRVSGQRVSGVLGKKNVFIPSGAGKNGNPFRYRSNM